MGVIPMINILYLHGFLSRQNSNKGLLLKDSLKAETMRVPVMPFLAMDCIERRIREMDGNVCLVGHSLGGFYATILSKRLNIPAVLLNPSVFPSESPTLKQEGILNGFDFIPSGWGLSDAIAELKSLESQAIDITRPDKILVLVQTGDELADHKSTIDYYDGSEHITIEGGNHKFENLQEWLPEISLFFSHCYRKANKITAP
jgi:uncharacterized protein